MEDLQIAGKKSISNKWKEEWRNRKFRILVVVGCMLLTAILISLPFFFTMIEKREGTLLNDPLLTMIPAFDLSVPIFILIWSTSLLYAIRCYQNPSLFVLAICSFTLIYFSRIITIFFLPLNPPLDIITLKDPLASLFYGGPNKFIQKDLFYSGHTSIQFIMFLSLTKKRDKIITFISTGLIGIFVLIQHIHYTIDVLGAFIFTYLFFLLGKKITTYK